MRISVYWASQVAQTVKHLPTRWETRVQSLGWEDPLRRKWQLTPVFLPGESHGWRSLVGYSPWGCRVRHDWATSLHWLNSETHIENWHILETGWRVYIAILSRRNQPFVCCGEGGNRQTRLHLESRTPSWVRLWTLSYMPSIYGNDLLTGKTRLPGWKRPRAHT